MWIARRLRALVAVVAIVSAACAEPPDREMQQAQGAIDAARAAGANVYAVDEFNAAQLALTNAEAAVEAGDYRLALSHAVDSRDRAQHSAQLAADGKAVARVEADRAITALNDAVSAARTTAAAAQKSRARASDIETATTALSHAEGQLQEARTRYDSGEYMAVVTLASEARTVLEAAFAALTALPPAAPRRAR
ncbi:MAG: hypothetical protein AB7F99_01245 [Vicinamibacterales bacterium]